MTRIALIAAAAENGVIGKDKDIPWRVKGDWAFFKKTSLGKPNIMGRVTFETLPEALPGRQNIVVTRNPDWRADGVTVCPDFASALAEAEKTCAATGADEIMIIGGEHIYREALPRAKRIYLTTIHMTVDGGHARFPEFDKNDWRKTSEEFFEAGKGDSADYTITIWDRD